MPPPLTSPRLGLVGFLPWGSVRTGPGIGQSRDRTRKCSAVSDTYRPPPWGTGPSPKVSLWRCLHSDPGSLSSPVWGPSCALVPGWPTASQLPPTWVAWWVWRLFGKPPSSHGSSLDIRLHSTTDTGDEELGKAQLAGKWGSKFLHPAIPPPQFPCPADKPLNLHSA